jgi:hypothetical protein
MSGVVKTGKIPQRVDAVRHVRFANCSRWGIAFVAGALAISRHLRGRGSRPDKRISESDSFDPTAIACRLPTWKNGASTGSTTVHSCYACSCD